MKSYKITFMFGEGMTPASFFVRVREQSVQDVYRTMIKSPGEGVVLTTRDGDLAHIPSYRLMTVQEV